jgi:hypothetical protein
MKVEVCRRQDGTFSAIQFEGPCRNAWIGKSGMGFGNEYVGFNAHWYDLFRPLERYSAGDTRFVFFWKQLYRGLRAIVNPKEEWWE